MAPLYRLVVMGGMDSPLRGSPFRRLRRLSHDCVVLGWTTCAHPAKTVHHLLNCLFHKDFSHKKRGPNGSLFLCLVVMGTIE